MIIDRNNLQAMGKVEEISDMGDFENKFKSFGWNVCTVDGHNHEELKKALSLEDIEKPTCIIANTVKGKGVSFMENNNLWHYRDPQGEYYDMAVKELEMSRP